MKILWAMSYMKADQAAKWMAWERGGDVLKRGGDGGSMSKSGVVMVEKR